MTINAQQLFNNALAGIRRQGYQRSLDGDAFACRYRGAGGRKCAIGFSIPDGMYRPAYDNGLTLEEILREIGVCDADAKLARKLQHAHDELLAHGAAVWEQRMANIAARYELTYVAAEGR